MSFQDELRRYGPEAAPRVSRREALDYCARLTATHYENFSVVTWLTPREHRLAFQSLYAFCRWSDDSRALNVFLPRFGHERCQDP